MGCSSRWGMIFISETVDLGDAFDASSSRLSESPFSESESVSNPGIPKSESNFNEQKFFSAGAFKRQDNFRWV